MSVITRPREVPTVPPPRPRRRVEPAGWWASGALALVVFWIAYEDGSSSLSARSALAIATRGMILLGVGLGFLPRAGIARGVVVIGSLLAAFAVDTFASVFWAEDAAGAFDEFDRAALSLGLFVLVAISVR